MNVLLDLEFSGLDNTYVTDNNVTQIKLMCVETGKKLCRNCKTSKPVSIYDRLRGITKYSGKARFSAKVFCNCLDRIGASTNDVLWGYSVQQDRKMLAKYGVAITIRDLQEMIRLNPRYERDLAVGCASMEAAYYLLTGEVPPQLVSHYDEREIDLIRTIHQQVQEFDPARQNDFLTIMPWGHCAGMPLDEYVAKERGFNNFPRTASGHRIL